MKIIMSRKGFDSSAGKIPSIIIGDKLVSFPIPNSADFKDTYDDLKFLDDINNVEVNYSRIINDLYVKKDEYYEKYLGKNKHCHVDPDIRKDVRKQALIEWEPIFGQSGSSAGYLINENKRMKNGTLTVEKGDLFLFFGNYREVELDNNIYRYKKFEKEKQLIWGWLFVDEIIKNPNEEFYQWHPHTYDENTKYKDKNVLFKASLTNWSSIGNYKVPPFGVFNYNEKRVLTADKIYNPNALKALWKYEEVYDAKNTKHDKRKNSSLNPDKTIFYAGRWQELILNNFNDAKTQEWLMKIFEDVMVPLNNFINK